MSFAALITDGLIARNIHCAAAEVVYVKSIVTAYDGLCCLISANDATVQLIAPRGREAELDLLVADLEQELLARKLENMTEEPSSRKSQETHCGTD